MEEQTETYNERDIQIYHCNKGVECISPDTYGCKGCENNLVPDLYDGGCKLLYQRLKELKELESKGRGKNARKLLEASNRCMVRAYKEASTIEEGIKWKRRERELEQSFIDELEREKARG